MVLSKQSSYNRGFVENTLSLKNWILMNCVLIFAHFGGRFFMKNHVFLTSIFASILIDFLVENCPKMAPKNSGWYPPFSLPKSTLAPKRIFGCLLVPPWFPFGALWLPFGSLWRPLDPFWLPSGCFWRSLVPFWLHLVAPWFPFGAPWLPFAPFSYPFTTFSQQWLLLVQLSLQFALSQPFECQTSSIILFFGHPRPQRTRFRFVFVFC